MKPKRHVCTCLTPATHWCPKTGGQYCQQHAERYASVFGEESLKLFPPDKPKPAIKESSELNDRIKRLEREVELLRLYGNKDCTAMADEALRKESKP